MPLKPFTLKLIYFGAGLLPLLLLAIVSKQDLEQSPDNLLWIGLFGAVMLASLVVQNKLRRMGVVNLKEVGTYAAFLAMAAIGILVLRQMV